MLASRSAWAGALGIPGTAYHGGTGLALEQPWFHGAVLLLIGLEYLGLCTALCPHGGRQDGPALRGGGRHVGCCLDSEAIADGVLGQFGLGGTTSLHALLPSRDRFHPIVEGMVTPWPWLAPTPPLPAPFVLRHSRLGLGDTGKPPGFDTLDGLCDLGGCLRLRCRIGLSSLGGQLT
jgi:hypothetical protein